MVSREASITALLALRCAGVAELTRVSVSNSNANTPDQQRLADRLRGHVAKLAEDIGERNVLRPWALHATADYIRGQWTNQGYQFAAHGYQVEGVVSENLEVTRPGKAKPDEIILIASLTHDTVPGSPGANDNASGVAALLELSRGFALRTPGRSVRFVGFVNEEAPFLWGQMGSMVYAKAARARGDDIRLMLSLEMLGCFTDHPGSQRYPALLRFFYPDRGNFLAFVSNLSSHRSLKQLVDAFRAHSDFPAESLRRAFEFIPGVAWSDHVSSTGGRALAPSWSPTRRSIAMPTTIRPGIHPRNSTMRPWGGLSTASSRPWLRWQRGRLGADRRLTGCVTARRATPIPVE